MDFLRKGHELVSNSEMSNFFSEQGRTMVCAESYMIVRRRRKPEKNAAQGKKGHFWMETISAFETYWGSFMYYGR